MAVESQLRLTPNMPTDTEIAIEKHMSCSMFLFFNPAEHL